MRFKEFYNQSDNIDEAVEDQELEAAVAAINKELEDALRAFTKLTNQVKGSAKIKKNLSIIKGIVSGNAAKNLNSMILGLSFPLKDKNTGFEARVKTINRFQELIKK